MPLFPKHYEEELIEALPYNVLKFGWFPKDFSGASVAIRELVRRIMMLSGVETCDVDQNNNTTLFVQYSFL